MQISFLSQGQSSLKILPHYYFTVSFIVPPAVIPYLADLLSSEDYEILLERTPAAAARVAATRPAL